MNVTSSYKEIFSKCLEDNAILINEDEWFFINIGHKRVAEFRFKKFPYCAAIALLCAVKVQEEFRGKGLGKTITQMAIDLAKAKNYSCLICTDVTTNDPMRKILSSYGFKDILNFDNQNNGNNVNLSVLSLYSDHGENN